MTAIVRNHRKYVVVLCSIGHVVEMNEITKSYGGSALAAELASRHPGDRFDRLADACRGAGHEIEV